MFACPRKRSEADWAINEADTSLTNRLEAYRFVDPESDIDQT